MLLCGICTAQAPVRGFMSHRGVHLRSTIAGENSLQAVDLAYRAGFWCIETDTRYTKDSVLVIMHDANINRTCTCLDGSKIAEKTPVASLTFQELRDNYRLKATRAKDRVMVPTLKEYLQHCKQYGFLVFIEPKLRDASGKFYLDIMKEADEVLGRDGYVITSNNYANDVIRNTLGIKDVRLMGLLYQTDYETMAALGNMIFAVSTTGFSPEDYSGNVRRAKADGYWAQSAAGLLSKDAQTDFKCFEMIGAEGDRVNLIATDEIAPDYHGKGKVVAEFSTSSAQELTDRLSAVKPMEFFGLYFEFSCTGKAEIVFGKDRVSVGREGGQFAGAYHKMFFDCAPSLSFENLSPDFKLTGISVKVVEF